MSYGDRVYIHVDHASRRIHLLGDLVNIPNRRYTRTDVEKLINTLPHEEFDNSAHKSAVGAHDQRCPGQDFDKLSGDLTVNLNRSAIMAPTALQSCLSPPVPQTLT
jgi:hypothetical protein